MDSGLIQAGSFSIFAQNLEFILACVKHYDPKRRRGIREIRDIDFRAGVIL